MTIEIKVPMLPESVADATVLNWHKQAGDTVMRDENLVDLETEKVVLEVPAPEDGVLQEIMKPDGSTVVQNEILGILKPGAVSAKPAAKEKVATKTVAESPVSESTSTDAELSPSVRRLVAEHNLNVSLIKGSGKAGRIVKDDVLNFIKSQEAPSKTAATETPIPFAVPQTGERLEKRVPMTRIRAKIAERLLSAQHNAAILTTFNEINLEAVMNLRKQYKDKFEKKHGVKLGFMSFFIKASIEALKRFPLVNASLDGKDVIYHGYYDIGVAVSTERGLVVPVLRNVDRMTMADIEKTINDYAGRARDGKLGIDEMTGGTFTISNGGVFGSLLSTPILNPPQSAILGMHKIAQRAMVEDGEVVIRQMMYVALSYDHQIIDGKDSVQFLATIKHLLEDPARMVLDI